MLTNVKDNIKQLKRDIRMGTANTNLTKQVVNIDELSKVVSEKLIYMVSDF